MAMKITPETRKKTVVKFDPKAPRSKEATKAAGKLVTVLQDVGDRFIVSQSHDQGAAGIKDLDPRVGQVRLEQRIGRQLYETRAAFEPETRELIDFQQTVSMAEGAAKGAMVFSASLVPGALGVALQRTSLSSGFIEKVSFTPNSEGTMTLTQTTGELDRSPGQPTLADFEYGEVGRDFPNREGYDKNFLGTELSMPTVGDAISEQIAPRLDEPDNHVLDYTHFSVIMNGQRRLPLVTAVNIDGSNLVRKKRQRTRWELDNRVAREHQIGNALYTRNDIDRGHMVRRLDPVWGSLETATRADYDTFTYDNSNPQHKGLNRKEWVALEDHVLEHARDTGHKITVFTGSINRADDPLFDNDGRVEGGIQIPLDFFKIAVMNDGEGGQKAVAFVLSQKELIEDIVSNEAEGTPSRLNSEQLSEVLDPGRFAVYQVPLSSVENLTHLDFGGLRDSDVFATEDDSSNSIFKSEAPPRIRRLSSVTDALLD
jgi:DNA/RNA endonuclease G (NUC1)